MLDEAIGFDMHLSVEGELADLCDKVLDQMIAEGHISGNRRMQAQNIRAVVANLYAAWSRAAGLHVSYSRNNHDFRRSRYNPQRLTRKLPAIVDGLEALGYVENHAGFYDRQTGHSRRSRMRADVPLLYAFQEAAQGGLTFVEPEVIELRQKDGRTQKQKPIKYTDTDHTERMRSEVRSINGQIEQTDIRLGHADNNPDQPTQLEVEHAVDRNQSRIRRVFSNGSWESGGRLYGGWWQRLSEETRQAVTIGGAETVELDYKAMQPTLAYLSVGIDYWQRTDADPYHVDGVAADLRPILKTAFLTGLNSDGLQSAARALCNDVADKHPEHLEAVPKPNAARELLERLARQHPDLEALWFQGKAGYLQFLESEVTLGVLQRIRDQGVPVLPIHDSFICRASEQGLLEEAMRDSLKAVAQEHLEMVGPECRIEAG